MMTNHPTSSRETAINDDDPDDRCADKTKSTNSVRFSHLAPDILYRIASKLPPKEFARTSALSSEWRHMSSASCPRLTFDAVAMCKCEREDLYIHVREFINEVSNILQTHRDKVVETLEIRIDFFDSRLAPHVDNWVDFAISSRTKNLTLDLKTERFWEYKGVYVFPFQLLDRGSISRIQQMQLSFLSLSPPPQFEGFPNLRKLHLQALQVSRKDLENMLSHCYTLEWLCIGRCNLKDELTIDSPLPRLVYLRVEWCLTKIKFNAMNLATFEYYGTFIPIDLVQSINLQSADIRMSSAYTVFQHMVISLLNGLPSVQNLTLDICFVHMEKQWLWENQLKFTNIKHLQLLMLIQPENLDKVLYSLPFLRATPFIEKLEVHFAGSFLWFAEVGPRRKDLGQCKCNYLRHIRITGFRAARGQIELILHVTENAPALEVLLVEIGAFLPPEPGSYGASGPVIEKVKQIARTNLCPMLPKTVTFDVRE